jgi:hypothetical protein
MTLQDFLKKYLGKIKGYPDDNSYKGECLSIVKLYIKEVFNISPPASGSGSAYGYWSNFPNPLGEVFEKVENTPDLIPQEGWIAIWKPWSNNQYGHIAIVAKGSTTGTLKNYAQNWTSRTFQLESNRYTNVIGFLKPSGIIEDMTEQEKNILNFLKEQKADEGKVREAFGCLQDMPQKNEQIQTLSAKVIDLDLFTKDLLVRIETLEGEIKANNDLVTSWQSEVKTANKQIKKISEELETMTQQKNKYKNYYEKALDKSAGKLSTIELFKLFIKKLFKK